MTPGGKKSPSHSWLPNPVVQASAQDRDHGRKVCPDLFRCSFFVLNVEVEPEERRVR